MSVRRVEAPASAKVSAAEKTQIQQIQDAKFEIIINMSKLTLANTKAIAKVLDHNHEVGKTMVAVVLVGVGDPTANIPVIRAGRKVRISQEDLAQSLIDKGACAKFREVEQPIDEASKRVVVGAPKASLTKSIRARLATAAARGVKIEYQQGVGETFVVDPSSAERTHICPGVIRSQTF